mmetsp:Transcript_100129/g.261625  ORF Transcript_100129/g.261625 Transcript_100129/m.261625 type:complete len:325 (-) Transcript_100129:131-1105(-)
MQRYAPKVTVAQSASGRPQSMHVTAPEVLSRAKNACASSRGTSEVSVGPAPTTSPATTAPAAPSAGTRTLARRSTAPAERQASCMAMLATKTTSSSPSRAEMLFLTTAGGRVPKHSAAASTQSRSSWRYAAHARRRSPRRFRSCTCNSCMCRCSSLRTTSKAVCAHSLHVTARSFSSAKRFWRQKLPAIMSSKWFRCSFSLDSNSLAVLSQVRVSSSMWSSCNVTSSRRLSSCVFSSCRWARFSDCTPAVSLKLVICCSMALLTWFESFCNSSCSMASSFTPSSSAISISSDSPRRRSASGAVAEPKLSAASNRAHASQRSSVR